jgi:hypothetical protein
MTYLQALDHKTKYQQIIGREYFDARKKQTEHILDIVVTPQDHPFFPEFISYYVESGSYQEASEKINEIHHDEIIYAVKCVLDEQFEMRGERPLHVLVNLHTALGQI